MSLLSTIVSPINEIVDSLGPNDLPYSIPLHPNLVHMTIGLFSIGIAFDYAGAFYPLEKRVFRFLALPVTRVGFHDVGWYNVLACSIVTFFTVAAGFYEMLLAVPLPGVKTVALLLIIVAMTIWRGFMRFVWRKDLGRQVSWLYLAAGAFILVVLGVHGSLGAWLASEFGVHITADQLLAAGVNVQEVLP